MNRAGRSELAERIERLADGIAERAVELHYRRMPELASRSGEAGRRHCLEDVRHHLTYLAEALGLGRSEIFLDYVDWGRSVLAERGIGEEHLIESLECLEEGLGEHLSGDDARRVSALLGAARSRLSSLLPETTTWRRTTCETP